MGCNSCRAKNDCRCNFTTKQFGVANLDRVILKGDDRTSLNWNEVSVPEIFTIPILKPDIEHLDQVYVEAIVTSAKLIETPFAYQSYERLATTIEINAAGAAYNTAAAISLTAVTTAYTALLAAAPNIPQKAALQIAYNNVVAAGTNYADALTALNTVIATPNVTASALADAVQDVIAALGVLKASLVALRAAAVALGSAAPSVATEVAALVAAIDTTNTSIDAAVVQLQSVITLIGNTNYFALIPNSENTYLTGRKLIVQGELKQKIVYTGLVSDQSVHSTHFCMPFSAFIIPYAKFEGLTYEENVSVIDPVTGNVIQIDGFGYIPSNPIVVDLCEDFCVEVYIEDIFAYALDLRTVFKNTTMFLQAKVVTSC